jgi:hypothetical protein
LFPFAPAVQAYRMPADVDYANDYYTGDDDDDDGR